MSDMIHFGTERARVSDATKLPVLDLLKMLVSDIESGKITTPVAMVATLVHNDDDRQTLQPYSCGLDDWQELGVYKAASDILSEIART
jgi:hypothetical protein